MRRSIRTERLQMLRKTKKGRTGVNQVVCRSHFRGYYFPLIPTVQETAIWSYKHGIKPKSVYRYWG
jgi:hypothetical protein